jgi:hypothetical protein
VVFRFGDHVLDIERRELRRGAKAVVLEPRCSTFSSIWCPTVAGWVSKDDLSRMLTDRGTEFCVLASVFRPIYRRSRGST